MGEGLVAELREHRPYKPGPEWWLLDHLAADADDGTRRTMCGYEYMAEKTHAPRRTIYRWLAKLREAGYLVVVENACPWVDGNGVMRFSGRPAGGAKGSPGRRAVYEIQIPATVIERAIDHLSDSDITGDGCHGGARDSRFVPDGGIGHNDRRVPLDKPGESQESGRRVPLMAPPYMDPIGRATVEGAWLRPDQKRGDEDEQEKNTLPECEARRAPAA